MRLTTDEEKVREILIDVARRKSIINYGRLVKRAGLESKYDFAKNPHQRIEFGGVLGDISEYEFDNDRPLLSCVVVGTETNMPGGGFFDLVTDLTGKEFANWEAKEEFAMKELNRIYDYWAAH